MNSKCRPFDEWTMMCDQYCNEKVRPKWREMDDYHYVMSNVCRKDLFREFYAVCTTEREKKEHESRRATHKEEV